MLHGDDFEVFRRLEYDVMYGRDLYMLFRKDGKFPSCYIVAHLVQADKIILREVICVLQVHFTLIAS